MDPNATWQMLAEHLRALHQNPEDEESRASAVELLQALTRWLRRGGFPPTILDIPTRSSHCKVHRTIHIRSTYPSPGRVCWGFSVCVAGLAGKWKRSVPQRSARGACPVHRSGHVL